jgi:hypothetical protein
MTKPTSPLRGLIGATDENPNGIAVYITGPGVVVDAVDKADFDLQLWDVYVKFGRRGMVLTNPMDGLKIVIPPGQMSRDGASKSAAIQALADAVRSGDVSVTDGSAP